MSPLRWLPTLPFLAAEAEVEAARAVLYGLPYDGTASFRAGAARGPDAVRLASQSIETYDPWLDRDLLDLPLADRGNADLWEPEVPFEDLLDDLVDLVAPLYRPGRLPLLLGGEHTVTLVGVEAARRAFPDLGLLVLDAHTDLRETYQGTGYSHACVLARLLERLGPERIALLGVRSGTREEFRRARELGLLASSVEAALARLGDRPIYLSVDVDVFDPSLAPGTGNPEPGGWTWADWRKLLDALRDRPVVAADLVEIAPPLDPTERTAILGAHLVRGMVLAFAGGSDDSSIHSPGGAP